MKRLSVLAAAVGLLIAGPAQAAWLKAEADRFIIYSSGPEHVLREYAAKLAAFDGLLQRLAPAASQESSPVKLEIYLVRDFEEMRQVRPGVRNMLGWYRAGPEGVYALAVASRANARYDDTLFHEYAHHFMLDRFPVAYPAWFVEGWAEYVASAQVVGADITLGAPDASSAYALLKEDWLALDVVLSKRVWELPRDRRGQFYAQAWLLTHYMQSTAARADQLNRALRAISAGEAPVKAFETATGAPLETLTRELRAYRQLRSVMLRGVATPPRLVVSRLPDSADDLLLDRLRLMDGAAADPQPHYLGAIRRRAGGHAGDRLAELTLAQAEFLYGDVARGEAILRRRLEASPDDIEALRIAGQGQLLAGERRPAERVARFRAGRAYLAKAYALDQTDYRTLVAYSQSRTVEPNYPTDNDVNALLEARGLAPAVQATSVMAARALIARGRGAEAEAILKPVANNPHGGRLAAEARALLAGKAKAEPEADEAEDGAPPAS
ncbi:hypothetical protein [Phenylobacterium sp.]|uniref:hypothetical protein n=1 Tax=Phenylobacterium sp. TaxID=1871053 RepID=UPI002C5E250E|nr:hypothetical protein [Phenylobacterium sp.]HVI34071.1 hypothetical protein [Phenylobacterium sp.]